MAQIKLELEKNNHPVCILRPWEGGAYSALLATPSKNPKEEYKRFLLDLQQVAEELERLGISPCGKDSFLFDLAKYRP